MLTKDYHTQGQRKARGPGRRKCLRCGRIHKPMSESVMLCGACSARALASAWRVLTR